ncbi:MAG: FHA domain-containing protein [Chthoniobacterales bacterium]
MRKLTIGTSAGSETHELVESVVTIGRAPENSLQLQDPSVSGQHARLELVSEHYQLTDLGSTNGTRVNGQPIVTAVTLRGGERLRFGKLEASYEDESAPAIQTPAAVLPEPVTLSPLPAVSAAAPAEVSARPADFANASPFPRRRTQSDPMRLAVYAAAGVALLAFLGSMLALLTMQPPVL